MAANIRITPKVIDNMVVEVHELVAVDIDTGNEFVVEREEKQTNLTVDLYKEKLQRTIDNNTEIIKKVDDGIKKVKK